MTNSTAHLPRLDMERIDQMASLACALPQEKPAEKWHVTALARLAQFFGSMFATPTRQTASGLAFAFASIACVVLVMGVWPHQATSPKTTAQNGAEYSISEYMIGDFLDEIV